MTQQAATTHVVQSDSARDGYAVVRLVVGMLLLVAAGLKGYELATTPVAETSLLTSRWFLLILVELEFALGLWLLIGLAPRMTWMVTLGCFGLFAGVALTKALGGEASCGCFGQVQVNPWITVTLDFIVIGALLCFPPRVAQAAPSGSSALWRGVLFMLLVTVLGLPAAYAMYQFQPAVLDAGDDSFGDQEFVVLEPAQWIGQRFPLAGRINHGNELLEGQWMVILFNRGCPTCQRALPGYEESAEQLASTGSAKRIALVEIPPYPDDPAPPEGAGIASRYMRLDQSKDWFVSLPTVIELQDGLVIPSESRGD